MEKIIHDLEKQLLSKVARVSRKKQDALELEKVKRYLNLVRQYYALQAEIDANGIIVETRNASQTFTKENPALVAQIKISAQLLAIEKSFSFTIDDPPIKHDDGGGLL